MTEFFHVEDWQDSVSNHICLTMTQDIYFHEEMDVRHQIETWLRSVIMWGDLDEKWNA